MNEEKQTYFGSLSDVDFTKRKKPVGIVAIVLLLAAIGGSVEDYINRIYNNTKNKFIYINSIYYLYR